MSLFSRKLRDFLIQERSRAEIDAMTDKEVSDLGLDRSDLYSFAAARPQMRMQMLRMAEKFGLEEEDVSRPRWRALETVHACRTCTRPEACFGYLTGHGDGSFGPADCPNAAAYAEIAAAKTAAGQ